MNYEIRDTLLPVNNPNRDGASLIPQGIVIHSTATPEATDENEYRYFCGGDRQASAHYFLDFDSISRFIPESEISYHAGRTANNKFIGIELCEFADAQKFQETWNRGVWLTADICKRYGLSVDKIYTHHMTSKMYGETNHSDPDGYFFAHNKTFEDFKSDVQLLLNPPQPQQPPKPLYKVFFDNKQQGAFGNRDNAYKLGWDSYNSGKVDTYLTTPENDKYTFDKHQDENPNKPQPAEPPKPQGTLILGNAVATLEQAKQWAKNKNASQKFVSLADVYYKIAPEYGVRSDIAYVQSGKETKFGNFGGVLDESFHNWCGMKNPAGGGDYDKNAHYKFPDDETGVRAHIQHLALYAGVDDKDTIVDPRHFNSIKGTAKTVEELIHWSSGADYGFTIVASYLNPMIATIVEPQPEPKPTPQPDTPTPSPIIPEPKPLPIPELPIPEQAQIPKGLVELIVDFLVKLFGLFGKK